MHLNRIIIDMLFVMNCLSHNNAEWFIAGDNNLILYHNDKRQTISQYESIAVDTLLQKSYKAGYAVEYSRKPPLGS